jgi:hypothetical protein
MLPFTREEFLAIFATYNEAIWPMQSLAMVLGAIAVIAIFWRAALSDRIVAACLGLMWMWTGIMYHILYFAAINTPAYGFGAMFVVQGILLILSGSILHQLKFGYVNDWASWGGLAFIGYAAFVYPVLGVLTGHAYPQLPMFGVTPCPVTIFTFGILLLTTARVPRWLLVIPVIWSLIGGSAAFLLGVAPDWLLLVSGLITIALLITRHKAHLT